MKHFYSICLMLLAGGFISEMRAQAVTHTIAEIQGELFSSPLVGQSVTTTGIVTANNVTSATSGVIGYFIQDGEGPWNGVFVYDNTQAPEIGDEVILEAEVQEFYDVTELGNLSFYQTVSTGNELPAASVVSTGELAQSEAYEGCLVQIINATCVTPDADYGEAIFDDGSGAVKTNDYMYLPEDGWIQDELYSITGCIHYTFEEYKIEPRNADDVVVGFVNGISAVSDAPHFNVFPNPAADVVRMDTDSHGMLSIFDGAGRVVLTAYINSALPAIDVSELAPGLYSLVFEQNKKRSTSQLFKL